MADRIFQYQPLWGSWLVGDLIGTGNFGKIYKISHHEYGQDYTSVVKIVSFPGDTQFQKAESALGVDEKTMRSYVQEKAYSLINEANILYSLSGNSNVLGYHDHQIKERENKQGWDVLIRMEYARPLPLYLAEKQMTRAEVIALGIDLCSALAVCARQDIIHRDIKDENIFISDDGIFKLGDFGIAMKLSKSSWTASMMGTPHYMAPEVYHHENYDAAVDIYSLGIVLYKLLNHGRLPKLPAYPAILQPGDDQAALEQRMNGALFAKPDQAGASLAKVIMKACAYKAADRYKSPSDLKDDLQKVLARLSDPSKKELVTMLAARTEMAGDAAGQASAQGERTIIEN